METLTDFIKCHLTFVVCLTSLMSNSSASVRVMSLLYHLSNHKALICV